ncbi:MAG: AAA family ATPase [Candidatus ainarchaeum sp.]|nr:AAA family ATPase [Candidatus ainarchaeum sp.]
MILGVTGFFASGKDTVGEYLRKKGFEVHSCSDIIREECKTRGIELTRDNLQKVGNELRENFGAGILAERLVGRILDKKHYVIESLRNPKEIDVFRKLPGFYLIFVSASPEVRYDRAKKRNKEMEHTTSLESFLESEKKELKNKDESAQQLLECKEMADYVLDNDSTIENLEQNLDDLMLQIQIRNRDKPNWDAFFLNIAKEHALRGDCLSARMGAVITVDNTIVSSGYTGAPRKTKDCYKRGYCIRRKMKVTSGQRYELCASVHAEQNAIINAARNGMKILGGTMYLYSEKSYHGIIEPIDAFPCFICKKMIINTGLSKVVCSTKDGSYKVYNIDDWVKEWQEKDISGEFKIYGTEYK